MKIVNIKSVRLPDFLTDAQIQRSIELYGLHGTASVSPIETEVIAPNLAAINAKLGQPNNARFLAYAILHVLSQANAQIEPADCVHCQRIATEDGDILPPACPAHGGKVPHGA